MKAIAAAVKGLVATIAAGGWVAVVVDEIAALNVELADRIAQTRRDAGPADKAIVSFNGRED